MGEKASENIKAEDWAGEMGERWLAHIDKFEGMIAPIGDALVAAVKVRPGERILDIGCGAGATTLALARAAGATSRVVGLDISPSLSRAAARRAEEAGLSNTTFITGDAGTRPLEKGAYDVLFSRFGVMFFEDPYAAFANLRTGLNDKGRMLFACWAPPMENEWIVDVMQCVMRHVEMQPPTPRAPGPFAFAEPDYVTDILTKAGFSDVKIEPWRGVQYLGGKGMRAKEAAEFVLNALSIGDMARKQPPEVQAALLRDITEAFAAKETPEGVAMKATAWFVSAKP